MRHADDTGAALRRPAASVPLACSHDGLLRVQRRLLALAERCDERFDRLQQSLGRLPGAATFDPFATASTLPSQVGAGAGAGPSPRDRGARPAAAALGVPQGAGARGDDLRAVAAAAGALGGAAGGRTAAPAAAAGTAAAGSVGALDGPAAASAQAGQGASPAQATAGASGLAAGWLAWRDASGGSDASGWLNALGGEQVAALMQRHAPPQAAAAVAGALATGGPGAVLSQAQQAQQAYRAHLGLQALMARMPKLALKAPAGGDDLAKSRRPAPMRQPGEAAGATGGSVASQGRPSIVEPSLAARAGSTGLATASALLEQLLSPGLGAAVGEAFGSPAAQGWPQRPLAPRAASRLLGAALAERPDDARAAAAAAPLEPAGTTLEAQDAGDALAQQISRLLLDQAWMRGVDLR